MLDDMLTAQESRNDHQSKTTDKMKVLLPGDQELEVWNTYLVLVMIVFDVKEESVTNQVYVQVPNEEWNYLAVQTNTSMARLVLLKGTKEDQ
jgi:hypothetical protein